MGTAGVGAGDIGRVDEATHETGASHLVIDTGPWIFGRRVMLPAGVVERIDTAEKMVYVDRTKDQIKDAPQYDDTFADIARPLPCTGPPRGRRRPYRLSL